MATTFWSQRKTKYNNNCILIHVQYLQTLRIQNTIWHIIIISNEYEYDLHTHALSYGSTPCMTNGVMELCFCGFNK